MALFDSCLLFVHHSPSILASGHPTNTLALAPVPTIEVVPGLVDVLEKPGRFLRVWFPLSIGTIGTYMYIDVYMFYYIHIYIYIYYT